MPDSDQNTRKVNQLTEDELKEISNKAGGEEAPKIHKNFQINSKDVEKRETQEGEPVYKVPISGDAFDRDGDQMALEGQEHMVEQLRSGKIPVFGDHGRAGLNDPRYSFTNILGQFIDGTIEEIDATDRNEGEKVTMADLRPDMAHDDAERLVHLLENDFPVGFSVGFRPLEVEEIHEDGELVGLKMLKIDLLEASAVGIPSQPDSVPAGLSENSEAAVAVKDFLDEKGGEVDVDSLKDTLENNISKDDNMGDEPEDDGKDSGDDPEQNDSNPEEQNDSPDGKNHEEEVKELLASALDEHKKAHYERTLENSLKEVEKFDDQEIEEIMAVVGGTISSKMDEAMEEIANELDTEDGDDEEEENGEDGDEEDEGQEENSSDDPDEENDGLDDDQKTGSQDSEDPKGTGPMTQESGKDGEPDEVDVSDEISDEELDNLSFGRGA